jgi:predicted permease
MNYWQRWRRAIGLGANRVRLEREMSEEMRFHIEMEARELMAGGMSPSAARRQAVIAFGGEERFRDAARDAMTLRWINDLRADFVYALRSLRRTPGFTLIAVSALGMGIGANSTVFGIVDSVTFRKLAAAAPDELVAVYAEQGDATLLSVSYPTFEDVRREVGSFRDAAAFTESAVGVNGVDGATVAWAVHSSDNYFPLLGVRAERGRLLEPGDLQQAVVVVSHAFWQTGLGSDPRVVGSVLRVNGAPFTIVGVAPASFTGTRLFTYAPALWLSVGLHAQTLAGSNDLLRDRARTRFNVIARLQPGVSLARASADAQASARRLSAAHPRLLANLRFTLIPNASPINPWLAPRERIELLGKLVLAGVGLVLLIACADVANLLLARMSTREHEIGVRLSLGASRGRLLRQFLTESVVLALLGLLAALPLAYFALKGMAKLVPPVDFPTSFAPRLDLRVLWFTMATALGAALLFGLAPMVYARSARPLGLQRSGSRIAAASGTRLRGALVASQVMVSVVVLFAAGLFARGLIAARRLDVGFDTKNAVVLTLDPRLLPDYDAERTRQLQRRLHDQLAALPGVRAVSRTTSIPLDGNSVTVKTFVDDRSAAADYFVIDENYVSTMGLRMVAGRTFTRADTAGIERVLINEVLARRLWSDSLAVGRQIRLGALDGPPVEVVGVVRASSSRRLGDAPRPLLWRSLERNPVSRSIFIVRGSGDLRTLLDQVRRTVHTEAPVVPIIGLRSLEQHVAIAYSAAQNGAWSALAFAALAGVLAAAGIYGVVSYAAARRTREIGIRAALGAGTTQVLRLIVRDGLRVSAIGALLGFAASFALPRSMSAILYGVSPRDPLMLVIPPLLFLLIAAAASLVPAWRAARINPIQALRPE